MVDKKLYTESSIESLSPLEFTRLRPGVYGLLSAFSIKEYNGIEYKINQQET